MTPIGHVGIALAVAYVLRWNLIVVIFCALLPDLVDKSLFVVGLGSSRYVAHTLLFVVLVAGAFFFRRRSYGLPALVGGLSHLLLDLNGFVPWFYPFVSYDFPERQFASSILANFVDMLKVNFTLSRVGKELIVVAVVWMAAFLCSRLISRYANRRRRETGSSKLNGGAIEEKAELGDDHATK